MEEHAAVATAREIMREFAEETGLAGAGVTPRRYLWTDAFAVCNFLELFRQTGDEAWRELALRLVDQVHHVLGRHRGDDPRHGWISDLGEEEGELHPTIGGLRIGKGLNERGPDEPADERLEWDRDGQYFHYLTKWLHALNRASRVSGDPACLRWALELAQTAHARFAYVPHLGGRKRMYWKMSIDLSRPLVPSMGQHDPLDGLVTCHELQAAARNFPEAPLPDLAAVCADMADICRGKYWATDDPLGIGGLLADAWRMGQLRIVGGFRDAPLLDEVLAAALRGLDAFTEREPLSIPAAYRLAFRELGLAIGLQGIARLQREVEANPGLFGGALQRRVAALAEYLPIAETIVRFWLAEKNRQTDNWREHREINMVMLATSLVPEEFLLV